VLFLVATLVSRATGNAHIGSWSTVQDGYVVQHRGVAMNLPPGPFLSWVTIAALYYSFDEFLTGQTIGKRLMGLKVIRVDGQPLSGRSVAVRTVGRAIDVLPAFYLIGWIAMRGPHRPPQRIGDRLAGTTVVSVSRS
jgi:uncharacterized RDD family membrane protein YckC